MSRIYLFFGPQGSGKSTQAKKLSDYLSLPYFNTGDRLRMLAETNSALGNAVAQTMITGDLVGNDILRQLFVDFIENNDVNRGFVTDGFPRSSTQLTLLEQLSDEYSWDILAVYVNIKDETVSTRLAHRTVIINGVETRREDDSEIALKHRLEIYRKDTVPIINWLKSKGEVLEIDGEPDVDQVFKEVLAAISSR